MASPYGVTYPAPILALQFNASNFSKTPQENYPPTTTTLTNLHLLGTLNVDGPSGLHAVSCTSLTSSGPISGTNLSATGTLGVTGASTLSSLSTTDLTVSNSGYGHMALNRTDTNPSYGNDIKCEMGGNLTADMWYGFTEATSGAATFFAFDVKNSSGNFSGVAGGGAYSNSALYVDGIKSISNVPTKTINLQQTNETFWDGITLPNFYNPINTSPFVYFYFMVAYCPTTTAGAVRITGSTGEFPSGSTYSFNGTVDFSSYTASGTLSGTQALGSVPLPFDLYLYPFASGATTYTMLIAILTRAPSAGITYTPVFTVSNIEKTSGVVLIDPLLEVPHSSPNACGNIWIGAGTAGSELLTSAMTSFGNSSIKGTLQVIGNSTMSALSCTTVSASSYLSGILYRLPDYSAGPQKFAFYCDGGYYTVSTRDSSWNYQDTAFRVGYSATDPMIINRFTQVSNLIANRVVVTSGANYLNYSAVTDTELGYLSGVTSSVQTQITNSTKGITDPSVTYNHLKSNGASIILPNATAIVLPTPSTDYPTGGHVEFLNGGISTIAVTVSGGANFYASSGGAFASTASFTATLVVINAWTDGTTWYVK